MTGSYRNMTVGDRAPNFLLNDPAGTPHELYNTDLTGGPIIVLVLASNDGDPLRRFDEHGAAFEKFGAHCYALKGAGAARSDGGFILLDDPGGEVAKGYLDAAGLEAPALFALDPNQRIVAVAGAAEVADFTAIAHAAFERIEPREEPRLVVTQAPVLLIPNVLEDDICDRLIAAWSAGEKEKNIINVASGDQTSRVARASVKRRSDFVIEGPLERELLVALMPRIAPEVERAFSFDREWGFEKFRVGCYEAEDAGFFRIHRDNPSEALQHRHFAASINLNDGYEGGYLRFPEHGVNHYAPDKGGVVVFSCGLLHEVVPVTAGRRFTLLTFISTGK